MTEEQLTPEEQVIYDEYVSNKDQSKPFNFGVPVPEDKHNVHSFLNSVATAKDTTKLGYLKEEEVGLPRLTLRTNKELALICDKIIGNKFLKEYYEAEGEIITSTSLSKDAKLINLAVMQKRQIEDVTKPRKENKGWFKKKENPENEASTQ